MHVLYSALRNVNKILYTCKFKTGLYRNYNRNNSKIQIYGKLFAERHRSVGNFIMNLISALGSYCLFENKPKALKDTAMRSTATIIQAKGRFHSKKQLVNLFTDSMSQTYET